MNGSSSQELGPISYDYYQELALGMLKMGIGEFYDLTPRELQNAIKGHLDFEDSVQQNEWERTRWQTAVLVNIQLPKGKSISPQQLVEFPWEKKRKAPKLTPEQVKERLAKWQRKE